MLWRPVIDGYAPLCVRCCLLREQERQRSYHHDQQQDQLNYLRRASRKWHYFIFCYYYAKRCSRVLQMVSKTALAKNREKIASLDGRHRRHRHRNNHHHDLHHRRRCDHRFDSLGTAAECRYLKAQCSSSGRYSHNNRPTLSNSDYRSFNSSFLLQGIFLLSWLIYIRDSHKESTSLQCYSLERASVRSRLRSVYEHCSVFRMLSLCLSRASRRTIRLAPQLELAPVICDWNIYLEVFFRYWFYSLIRCEI